MVVFDPLDACFAQFDSLLCQCLLQQLEAEEFLAQHCQTSLAIGRRERRAVQAGLVQPSEHEFDYCEHIEELSRRILKIASGPSFAHNIDAFELALEYLGILQRNGLINAQNFIDSVIGFDFDPSSNLERIEKIVEHLNLFSQRIQCAYNDSQECTNLCLLVQHIIEWQILTLEKVAKILVTTAKQQTRQNTGVDNDEELADKALLLQKLIKTILKYRERPFTALLLFIYYSEIAGKASPDPMPRLQVSLANSVDLLRQLCDDFDEMDSGLTSMNLLSNCLNSLYELADLFPGFATPPSAKWTQYREDFIHRRNRPAILTLCSIFAIFRVLKSADEVADSFLTVGEVLGIGHEQIVEDLLRGGFLIQLETASTSSAEQRDREALADVFVFLKLPQVLSRLLEKGVQRNAIYTALCRICECESLLDELDAKKSDNVFRFFLDAVRKAEVIGAKEFEMLVSNRDQKRAQNEELLQQLRSISHSASANDLQMVRSELISRVQKAKRGIDTLVPENTEMLLRRLLSLGEFPIDMLCSIYCACGELSIFSSKLAALNAQSQSPTQQTEGATNPNTQGRLLIFDSTFLLMARIQSVFADMRLEELVGGRLFCTFYRWTQRNQKCIEDGEPMGVVEPTVGDDENAQAEFRTNFQQNQFQAMRQQKQPFWSPGTSDFGTVIETIPLVGELLLDEFNRGQPDSLQIQNVFWTFRHMSCLWLCLVQWLDTQSPSAGKQAMARAMREFESNWLKQQHHIQQPEKDSNNERFSYSMLLARRTLRQMAEVRVKKEHPYTWLIGFAQRPLPSLPLPISRKMSLLRADRDEIKEENQRLKEVFLCANQQGWASPVAIAHINRCNESCRMDIWLQCWMRQMMNQQRVVTVDEGELAAELCLAATMTYPVPCLCEMVKQLVECVLFERPTSSSSTAKLIMPNPNAFLPQTTPNESVEGDEQQTQTAGNLNVSSSQQQQPAQNKPHTQLPHLLVARHPVVGQLSTKATVLAKMLVRAMQLLLWAGDRRAVEKRERERRIQQLGIGSQMEAASGSRKRKQSTPTVTTKQQYLKPPRICGGLEPTSSEGSGGEEFAKEAATKKSELRRQSIAVMPMELEESGSSGGEAPKISGSKDDVEKPQTSTSSSQEVSASRQPKDAFKAQLTVRNVFERFERIVRDCTLRPPVTFIIFFIHELAQAPRTEYWQRLVSLVPVELLFALARLDSPAVPLELFLRIYDPGEEKNRKHCLRYACMLRKLGRI